MPDYVYTQGTQIGRGSVDSNLNWLLTKALPKIKTYKPPDSTVLVYKLESGAWVLQTVVLYALNGGVWFEVP